MGQAILGALLALLALAARASSRQTIPLHTEATWELDNGEGYDNVTLSDVKVPSLALEALMDAGLLGDPLYRWVAVRGPEGSCGASDDTLRVMHALCAVDVSDNSPSPRLA